MVVRMDTTPFVESLRRDLLAAAEAAGPDGKAAAERMLLAFEPAMRLALLDALSQATAEITAELPAGVVEVRLRGREPELVVDVPPPHVAHEEPADAPGPAAPEEDEDDGTVARITLRIPESVKARAEELAGRSGHSLNAWIVNVLRAATTQRAINVDIDLSSLPFLDHPGSGRRPGGRRMSGWV
jgi:hypothetical protein